MLTSMLVPYRSMLPSSFAAAQPKRVAIMIYGRISASAGYLPYKDNSSLTIGLHIV